VGFYSTGPRIRANDTGLDLMFRKYCANPCLVIIDVRADAEGIPTQAYYSVDEVSDSKESNRSFKHVLSEVGAYEAEEVGVEHLLRDINDPTVSTLASRVQHKMTGLTALQGRLEEMQV
jgi:26S proteasome regulatory subunit N8